MIRALARWTWRIATAWLCYLILVSCGSAPGRYDATLAPPVLGLDHCAMALTEDGESIRLCASAELVCRYAVGLAKRYGRSWIIRPATLRLGAVGDCRRRPQLDLDVQRVELR